MKKRFTMRKIIRRVFNQFVRAIPVVYSEEMFREIGSIFGILSFTCDGNLGLFEGSIDDRTVHSFYLRYHTWEPSVQLILNQLFDNRHGTFIDVGANIGLTAIPIAKYLGITCYCFEPEYNNYILLRKNIIANGVESKIKTFNFALFSDDCNLEMELSDTNKGDHRVRKKSPDTFGANLYNETSRRTTTIKACKLDSVLNEGNLDKPIVMKIDTQGAEVQVFKGASIFLREVDYLIVEYWPYGLHRLNDSANSFIEIIKQFPFGVVYDDNLTEISKLYPISDLKEKLSKIPQNGSSSRHHDILLSRHPKLTGYFSEN